MDTSLNHYYFYHNMDDILIIGMSGKMGVGKNYISETFLLPLLFEKAYRSYDRIMIPYFFSFGSCIKTELYGRDKTDSLNYNDLFESKTHHVRKMLQEYGTEMGRNTYHPDIWIRQVDMWIQIQNAQSHKIMNSTTSKFMSLQRYIPVYIIQDVRFQNELDFVLKFKNHLVMRVEAPNRHNQRLVKEGGSNGNHTSETSLDESSFDHVIHNDYDVSTERIESQIEEIVDTYLQNLFS